jgi:hypothetical protein
MGIDFEQFGFAGRAVKTGFGRDISSVDNDPNIGAKEYAAFQNLVDNKCMSCHGAEGPGASFAELKSASQWGKSTFIDPNRRLAQSSVYNRLKGVDLGVATENMPLNDSLSIEDVLIVSDFIAALPVSSNAIWELKRDLSLLEDNEMVQFDSEYLGFLAPKIALEIKNNSTNSPLQITDIKLNKENDISLVTERSFNLAPGEKKSIILELKAERLGTQDQTITISTNSEQKKSMNIQVQGEIIASTTCNEGEELSQLEASTNDYFKYSLLDLLGVSIVDIESHLPKNLTTNLRGNLKIGRVDAEWFLTYRNMLEKVLDVALQIEQHSGFTLEQNQIVCNLDLNNPSNRSCVKDQLIVLSKRALGKGYNDSLDTQLDTIIDTGLNAGISGPLITKELLLGILINPHFTVYAEPATGQISDLDLVKKIYRSLYRSVPSLGSYELAANGQFSNNLDGILDTMLTSPSFKERGLKSFINYYLNKDYFFEDLATHSQVVTASQINSLWESFSKSLEYIYEENLPLSSILTLDKIYINSDIASFTSGLNSGSNELELVETSTHRGLAMHPAFLAMTAKESADQLEPLAPRRAKFFNGLFYCEEFNVAQPAVPHVEPIAGQSYRHHFEDRTKGASCMNCHRILNPMGFAFHDKDFFGNTRNTDSLSFQIDASGTLNGDTFANSRDLANIIAQKSRFVHCFSGHVYNYIGFSMYNSIGKCNVKKAVDLNSDLSIKNIIKNIIMHPSFVRRQ